MEVFFGISTFVLSIIAIIISLFGLYHNRMEAVNAFFENDRSETLLRARSIVHSLEENYNPIELMKNHGDEIAFLIISYNQAAVLIQKRQLPFWVFSKQASSGYAVMQIWKKLKPYIDMRRNGFTDEKSNINIYPNPSLANPFEALYNRIEHEYSKR